MGNDEGVKRCLDELAEGRQGGGEGGRVRRIWGFDG